jgi:hypothetical protein
LRDFQVYPKKEKVKTNQSNQSNQINQSINQSIMNFLPKVRFNKSIYRVDPTSVGNTTNSVDTTSVGNTSNSVSSTSLEFTPNQIQDLGGEESYEGLPFNREKANNFEGFFPEDDDSEYGEEPYEELRFNREKANNFEGFFPEDDDSEYGEEPYEELRFNREKANNFKGFFPEKEEIYPLERSIEYFTNKVVFPECCHLSLSQAHEMLDYYRFVMESQCPGLTPCYANPLFEDKKSVLRSAGLYKEYWQKNKCNSLLTDEECHISYYRHIGLFSDKSKEDAESNGIGPLERSPGIYGDSSDYDSSDYDSEEEENNDTDEEPNEELPVRYEPCSCKEHQGSMYQRVSCTANKVKKLREKEDFTEQLEEQPEEEEN